jgi:hypothetical protein
MKDTLQGGERLALRILVDGHIHNALAQETDVIVSDLVTDPVGTGAGVACERARDTLGPGAGIVNADNRRPGR